MLSLCHLSPQRSHCAINCDLKRNGLLHRCKIGSASGKVREAHYHTKLLCHCPLPHPNRNLDAIFFPLQRGSRTGSSSWTRSAAPSTKWRGRFLGLTDIELPHLSSFAPLKIDISPLFTQASGHILLRRPRDASGYSHENFRRFYPTREAAACDVVDGRSRRSPRP